MGRQISALLERSYLDNWRNPSVARAKIIQKSVMGLFIGLLYLQVTQIVQSVKVQFRLH